MLLTRNVLTNPYPFITKSGIRWSFSLEVQKWGLEKRAKILKPKGKCREKYLMNTLTGTIFRMKAGKIKTKQDDTINETGLFTCSLCSFLNGFSLALSYCLSLLNGNLDSFTVIHYCNSLKNWMISSRSVRPVRWFNFYCYPTVWSHWTQVNLLLSPTFQFLF